MIALHALARYRVDDGAARTVPWPRAKAGSLPTGDLLSQVFHMRVTRRNGVSLGDRIALSGTPGPVQG